MQSNQVLFYGRPGRLLVIQLLALRVKQKLQELGLRMAMGIQAYFENVYSHGRIYVKSPLSGVSCKSDLWCGFSAGFPMD